MPLVLIKRRLAVSVLLSGLLLGCVANPPANHSTTTLQVASQQLSDDLLNQVHSNILERLLSKSVVLDPFIDSQSGQRTASSIRAAQLVGQRLQEKNTTLKLKPFNASGVEQSDYLIAGTIGKTHPGSNDYVISATITDRRTGTVIANATSRVHGSEIDTTPTTFHSDSPSLVSDRLTRGYINTSTAATGSAADQAYLASISTAALINEATTAYEEKRWQDALLRYQIVVQRTDGKQLRVFNGLYNSYTKLGKAKEAETAFEDIVKLGLATNNLSVRLLFNPGSTEFWKDPSVSGIYPMWLRKIASVTYTGDYCMTVVGHTSKTGSETTNDRLSLSRARAVRDMLVSHERRLGQRIHTDGVGWRENIIGSGTDDARDSLDRRVEFKVRNC